MASRALILLGPPGAGKGTQGSMLAKHYHYSSLSTGDVLRDEVRQQTDLGKKAQRLMESGVLVSDDLVNEIVKARLAGADMKCGFILDGYPRTLDQAAFLEKLAAQAGIHIRALGIMVDDEHIVARLSRRWNCPDCGRIYNDGSNPARKQGVCDDCGAALTQRKDDRAEVVRERLRVYHHTTQPLVDFYRRRGQYLEVNGEAEAGQIFESIVGILDGEERNRTAFL
jgi:adenylate kinase